MTTMASQITSLTMVYSIVYSDADQRKHQSSGSLAFVRGIHRWHKGPVTRKCFHLMTSSWYILRGWFFNEGWLGKQKYLWPILRRWKLCHSSLRCWVAKHGQLRGKCFHLVTSSCIDNIYIYQQQAIHKFHWCFGENGIEFEVAFSRTLPMYGLRPYRKKMFPRLLVFCVEFVTSDFTCLHVACQPDFSCSLVHLKGLPRKIQVVEWEWIRSLDR